MENLNNYNKVEKVIAGMAITDNFWGYLFGRVRKVETSQIPSIMGVGYEKNGGVVLFYHPHLVEGTTEPVLEKILEHEGVHLLNCHLPRCIRLMASEVDEEIKNRKMQSWYIAADLAVNTQINMPDKIKVDGQDWPAQHPKMYDLPNDRSTESYFHSLLEINKNKCIVCGSKPGDSEQTEKSESNSESGDNNSQQEQSDNNNNSQESGNGQGQDKIEVKSKCPCCGKEHSTTFNIDYHGEWNDKNSDTSNFEDQARKIEDQIKNLVRKTVKAYESSSNSRGNLPGYLRELIDELLVIPKIPYYELIKSLVKGSRLAKWRKSYTRINKKRVYNFFDSNQEYINPIISPFPGKTRDFSFNIVVMIDTSMSQSIYDLAEALSGIKDIIENDKNCKTTVIEIDTTIGKEYVCKKISDIDYNISGRGGTVLRDGVIRAGELKPDIMLGFTDGHCDNINELPYSVLPKKMIWCISPGGTDDRLNKTGHIVWIDPKE